MPLLGRRANADARGDQPTVLRWQQAIPKGGWVVRYFFGFLLISLALIAIWLAVFETETEPKQGVTKTNVQRTYEKPRGFKKARLTASTRTVTSTPKVEGGRPEWFAGGLLFLAAVLALAGAWVDREQLSVALGKGRSFSAGPAPPAEEAAAATVEVMKSVPAGEPKQAARAVVEAGARTQKLTEQGVPVDKASEIAALAATTESLPPPPELAPLVDAVSQGLVVAGDDLDVGQLALSGAKAVELASAGASTSQAAAQAVADAKPK